ncbi:MAG TPA: alpha/beta hydrolase [Hyphomicrobiaceae bacterium]|nr:alpha/beta hydrolase [Hyphomicrobiaceae bacterium]
MHPVDIDGHSIEVRTIPGDASLATLVFLHEGLGSVALWRDFPDKVSRQLRAPAVIYSRVGYGQSSGLCGPRSPDFMHREALDVLPKLLDRLGITRPLLIGHSDGASIAIIHAASSGREVAGAVLMAPHVLVEPVCTEAIGRALATYQRGDLRQRLARYHRDVDDAFLGWARIWLSPTFKDWSLRSECGHLAVPLLLIQGRQDEYGSLLQLDVIEDEVRRGGVAAGRPVPEIQRVELDDCRHSPHRDQEARVIAEIAKWSAGLRQRTT